MSKKIKIAFFGTPYVAKDTFTILYDHGIIPTIVITNPDTKSGRGLELHPSPVKKWAQDYDLPFYTPETLNVEAIQHIQSFGCDYAIVVAYGKIFPQVLIDIFPKGVLNIHYSLLPKYRGASPVEAALLNNDAITGVTIQKMTKALDAGDIVAVKEMAIEPLDTTVTLRPKLITLGAELLCEILPEFESDTIAFSPQDHTKATHTGKILKEEGRLELTDDDNTNWRKYRAYAESPGTHFFIEKNGRKMRVKITEATLSDTGEFIILKVIPEGKKECSYDNFLASLQ